MFCPKCKTKVKGNSKFCEKCGTEIKNTKSGEEYLTAYLNRTRESMLKEYISFPTLLFGPFFYLYKKMWNYSVYYILIYVLADLIPSTNISILVKVITNIIASLTYRFLRIKSAEIEIEKIKLNNKKDEDIIRECKIKGKSIDLKIIIIVFLIYIAAVILLRIDKTPQVDEEKQETNKNTMLKISYEIPEEFEESTYEDYYRYYTYNEDKTCFITITSPRQKTYKTSIEYLRDTTKSDDGYKRSEFDKKIIDGVIWDKIYLEKETSKKEYFALKYYTDIYSITFESIDEDDNCNNYKEKVLKNIRFY